MKHSWPLLLFFVSVSLAALVACPPPPVTSEPTQKEPSKEVIQDSSTEPAPPDGLPEPAKEAAPDGLPEPAKEAAPDGLPEPAKEAQAEANPETPITSVTWYKNVLPIVQKNCWGCHTEGGIGPFQLKTYQDAKDKAKLIQFSVDSRRMPPWMPDETCQPSHEPRLLSDGDIKTISAWVDGGTLEGDPKDATNFQPKIEKLDWEDRTLDIGVDYKAGVGQRADDYHCFVLDPKLTQDEAVIGFEVVPGQRSIVHHVLVYAVDLAAAKAKEATAGKGWTCYGGPGVSNPVLIGGWVPGSSAVRFPPTTGIGIQKTQGFVMQIHYNTSGVTTIPADRTQIRLQFARSPVQRPAIFLPLPNATFSIPAKSQGYKTSRDFPSPSSATIWGVAPHMHQLGTKIRVEIIRSGATHACLVDIPKWDFNWQQTYFYKNYQTVQVKPGDTIRLTCFFDNPTDKAIRWGENTTDEMCLNYIYATSP